MYHRTREARVEAELLFGATRLSRNPNGNTAVAVHSSAGSSLGRKYLKLAGVGRIQHERWFVHCAQVAFRREIVAYCVEASAGNFELREAPGP